MWDIKILVMIGENSKGPSEFPGRLAQAFCMTVSQSNFSIFPNLLPSLPPKALILRAFPTFPPPQSSPQNLTPRNKTGDSCVQEWSEKADLTIRFWRLKHQLEADNEKPLLVLRGAWVDPGARQQYDLKL